MSDSLLIKARGLPWSATTKEIANFFGDVTIANGEQGIHLTMNKEGRPSGEAFIEVATTDDLDKALAHNNEHMGKRYIEVQNGKYSELEWVLKRANSSQSATNDGVVRLRGLPFGCTKQDIAEFFTGLQIIPYGITVTMDQDGRASGEAYVEFASPEIAEKALLKHKEKIGHRWIEIFKSSKEDIKHVTGGMNDIGPPRPLMSMNNRPGPYDRPGQGRGGRGGRGGMNMGPSGFNNQGGFGGGYGGGDMGMGRGGRGGRGGRARGAMGGGMGEGMGRSNEVQNSKTGHSIHMRGLPFEANLKDVMDFFAPVNPVDVRLLFEDRGRPKGECDVDFATHADAEASMKKNKQNMGHRYIELFLQSDPPENSGWGGGNMNQGGNMGNSYGGGFGGGNMGGGAMGGGPMGGGPMGGGPMGGGPMGGGPMGGGMNQGYNNFNDNQGGYGGGGYGNNSGYQGGGGDGGGYGQYGY